MNEPLLPESEAPAEPRPSEVLGRFVTAARALAFAEQAMQAAQRDQADCYQTDDGSWWVEARLLLGPAREMVGLGGGRLYVRSKGGFTADRGWGDEPTGTPSDLPELTPVAFLDLVRVAGLHPVPTAPLRETCVLVPGHLVRGVVERAQDLRLRATYHLVRLEPLFSAQAAPWTSYAVWLSAPPPARQPMRQSGPRAADPTAEALPAALLSALVDDPFALVCRPVDRTLLVAYGTASPLSDGALARLVAAAGDGTWLLSPPPEGCARVTWQGAPLDAASLVELGPAHRLLDTATSPAHAAADAHRPAPQPLTLVPTAAHAAPVDAVLLDDPDLDCLPLLLAGDPIADAALLIRGNGRHLLTAPGGLLIELPVGESLTCVGPGSIYLPLGFRLDPPVGPSARAALFEPDRRFAQVVLRDMRLGFDLDAAEPVWRMWSGPVPALDLQLSRQELNDIDEAAALVGDPPQPAEHSWSWLGRPRFPAWAEPVPDPANWRWQAFLAERNRDFAGAARLYARHNEPLRAARMWEREARENY